MLARLQKSVEDKKEVRNASAWDKYSKCPRSDTAS